MARYRREKPPAMMAIRMIPKMSPATKPGPPPVDTLSVFMWVTSFCCRAVTLPLERRLQRSSRQSAIPERGNGKSVKVCPGKKGEDQ
jgi:hypothetical protein